MTTATAISLSATTSPLPKLLGAETCQPFFGESCGSFLQQPRLSVEACPHTYVYVVAEDQMARNFSLEYAKHWLDDDEWEHVGRIVAKKRLREFIYARFFVKAILAYHMGIDSQDVKIRIQNSLGKPVIAGPNPANIQFNLSHSDGILGLCVARDCPVGIDIEKPTDHLPCDARQIAAQHFSPVEAHGLRRLTDVECARQFHRIWTLKESALKAIGCGLSSPMSCVDTAQLNFSDCMTADIKGQLYRVYSGYLYDSLHNCHLAVARVGSSAAFHVIAADSILDHLADLARRQFPSPK